MTRTTARMVNMVEAIDNYRLDFRDQDVIPDWLHVIRDKAMNTFETLGLPTRRRGNEKWKYTNIAPIARNSFNLAQKVDVGLESIKKVAPWDDAWTNLVFVNGFYNKDLSSSLDQTPYLVSLSDVIKLDDGGLEILKSIGNYIDYSDDGFAALNTAFLRDAMVVNIPEAVTVERPVNVIFYNCGIESTVNYPRIFLIANRNSRVSVIESYVGDEAHSSLTNSVSEIVGHEGSVIDHYRILDESEHVFNIGYGRVMLAERSSFRSTSFYKSAKIGRYDLNVCLNGTDVSCELNGLYSTSGSAHMDNYINVDHAKPNGRSDLLYKGILDGKSRAVFGGTVLVRRDAQKTESTQSDKNLVLSSQAEIDSKPALYIYADDVKCAHGATAGNIDADTIFYMRSRGLDLGTASRLLIYGFAEEIIDKVRIPGLRKYLEEGFLSSLPNHRFEF